jgi:hypothetical protein
MITRIFLLLFLAAAVIATAPPSWSQKNPICKKVAQMKDLNQRKKSLERVGVTVAYLFAVMGYSVETIRDLNSAGIDIVESLPNFYGKDEKTKTVLSDCIAIGKVERIEYDSAASSLYHTITYIHVDEFLRNDYMIGNAEIMVCSEAGPLGGGEFQAVSHDVKFVPGERVLLFLTGVAALMRAKDFSPRFYKKIIREDSVRFEVTGSVGGKYLIEGQEAVFMGQRLSLAQLRGNVMSTIRVLEKTVFGK